jgi:hypothetical protein
MYLCVPSLGPYSSLADSGHGVRRTGNSSCGPFTQEIQFVISRGNTRRKDSEVSVTVPPSQSRRRTRRPDGLTASHRQAAENIILKDPAGFHTQAQRQREIQAC